MLRALLDPRQPLADQLLRARASASASPATGIVVRGVPLLVSAGTPVAAAQPLLC